jgi:L-2-hydroxyglutarate oxidase
VDPEELREVEPHASGVAAIKIPSTRIVDFVGVAKAFAEIAEELGGELRLGAEVTEVSEDAGGAEILAGGEVLRARILINCAGLHSDRGPRSVGFVPGSRRSYRSGASTTN